MCEWGMSMVALLVKMLGLENNTLLEGMYIWRLELLLVTLCHWSGGTHAIHDTVQWSIDGGTRYINTYFHPHYKLPYASNSSY